MSSSSSSSEQQQQQPAQARETAEEKLLRDAAMAISLVAASVVVLRAIAASLSLYASLLPLIYLWAVQTCPPRASFDAKRELKRVLRGDSLPQDHPDKPKPNTLSGFMAGAMATLTSELATLPGYELEMSSLWGAAVVATVTLPTSDLSCTWIGCNHRWYYFGSRRLSESPTYEAAPPPNPRVPESATVNIGGTNIKFDFGKQE